MSVIASVFAPTVLVVPHLLLSTFLLGLASVLAAGPRRLSARHFRRLRDKGASSRRALTDTETLTLFAQLTSLAAHNTRLYQAGQQELAERKRADAALRKNETAMRILYEVTSAQPSSFEDKLQALLTLGCGRWGLPLGMLTRLQDDRLEVIAAQSPDLSIRRGMVWPLQTTFCRSTLELKGPLSIENAACSEWRNHAGYQSLRFQAYIGAPVIVAGVVYGTLAFASRTSPTLDFLQSDREFLRLMAQWIGGEIERNDQLHQLESYAAEIALKNAELAVTRDQALIASRFKSEFLANMSHEIRTPLHGIIGMLDLLTDTPLSHQQQEYAAISRDSAQALLAILNDILDFSKIEAGKIELEKVSFSPAQVLEGATDLLRSQADRKQIALKIQFDPAIPNMLAGDPGRLRQVLLNLISNAIKFTPSGEVEVRASLRERTETSTVLDFAVRDTGIGLSPAAARRIFSPFTQADGSTTRRYGGTGLGLSISQRLVALMGGELAVESALGQGSTFRFAATFGRPNDSVHTAQADKPTPLPSPSRLDLPILVVEDNIVNQRLAELQINKLGYTAVVVDNGQAAVDVTARNRFAAVLMDCQMPLMDGFAATAAIRLREDGTGQHVPILAMTASAMTDDRERCLQAGMDDYLTKPVDLQLLRAHLSRWIEVYDQDSSVDPESPLSAERVLDPLTLQTLRAFYTPEHPGFWQELVDIFLEDASALIASMTAAARQQDVHKVVALAHTLKGSTANMGATALATAVRRVEDAARNGDHQAIESGIAQLQAEHERVVAVLGMKQQG